VGKLPVKQDKSLSTPPASRGRRLQASYYHWNSYDTCIVDHM